MPMNNSTQWFVLPMSFDDSELETAFRQDYDAKNLAPMRLLVTVTLLFMVLLVVVLAIDLPRLIDPTVASALDERLRHAVLSYVGGVEIPLTVVTLVVTYVEPARPWVQPCAAVSAFSVLFSVTVTTMAAPAGNPALYAGMILAVATLAAYAGFRLRFGLIAAVSWLASLTFCLAVVTVGAATPFEQGNCIFWLSFTNIIGTLVALQTERYARNEFIQQRTIADQQKRLVAEQAKSEQLLLNVLPAPIAERLKREPAPLADGFDEVSVLFADIVDFTRLSERLTPRELVETLNQVFSKFDQLVAACGLEKIKTIGDAYMAASGIPEPRADHIEAIADLALQIRAASAEFHFADGTPLTLRMGIDSGPVVAGVIGETKFAYDLWGDTVNTASRMEAHGPSGAIQVTEACYRKLDERFELEAHGAVEIKGKGLMTTYLLKGRRT
jgi:class 3 adenylate cyclase